MTICFINIQEFNPMIGGIESVSVLLAGELIRRGHMVVFLAFNKSSYSQEYELPAQQLFFPVPKGIDNDMNYEFLCSVTKQYNIDIIVNQFPLYYPLTSLCSRAKADCGFKLVSVLHFNPDFLETSNSDYLINAKKNGRSPNRWGHSLLKYCYFKLYKQNKLYERNTQLFRRIHTQSDAFVLLSDRYFDAVCKRIDDFKSEKLYAISNPITLLLENDNQYREKENILLFVGRLTKRQKRPERLINIWKRISPLYPNWKLIMVGDGEYRRHLEKMVTRNGIERVEFVGFQTPTDYYLRSKIVCMTSPNEGFGMVLVEAQQNGCVPIAYNSFGALSDIINDGVNGFSVKPFSQKEYIQKLRRLMDDESLRQNMAKASIESVKRFDVKIITEQWLELFNELLSK